MDLRMKIVKRREGDVSHSVAASLSRTPLARKGIPVGSSAGDAEPGTTRKHRRHSDSDALGDMRQQLSEKSGQIIKLSNEKNKLLDRVAKLEQRVAKLVREAEQTREWRRVLSGRPADMTRLGLATSPAWEKVALSFKETERTQLEKEASDEAGDRSRFLAQCFGEGERCFHRAFVDGEGGQFWEEQYFELN